MITSSTCSIQTYSPIVQEIRALRIDSIPGESVSGEFKLHYACYSTPYISYNVSAASLRMILEDNLNAAKISSLQTTDRSYNFCPGIGKVQVSRYTYGVAGGVEWRITFTSAVGAVQPLTISSYLKGQGASIFITSITSANVISGSFSLLFMGHETRPLPYNISADDMKTAIMLDFPFIVSADVLRTDPTGNCGDGLCWNGPTQSLGYTWVLSMTTSVGNKSPHSPTSTMFDYEGKIEELAAINDLIGCVNGVCPQIVISSGHNASILHIMRGINLGRPFSLSYGGSGGGYGGKGGRGFRYPPIGQRYGDVYITNLHGGSGGASGLQELYQLTMDNIFSRARGGSGGGAIEIIASNDIVVGPRAKLSCDGESGWDNFATAGGGGAGGSILLSAGGAIIVRGKLSARGGSGGNRRDIIRHNSSLISVSGGGGGGRIAMYGQSLTMDDVIHVDVAGGNCQSVSFNVDNSCRGENGTVYFQNGLQQKIRIDSRKGGAMETSSAMIIKGIPDEKLMSLDGNSFNSYLFHSGPEYVLKRSERPTRLSFFIKLDINMENTATGWGALIEIRSHALADIIDRGNPVTSEIALFVGEKMRHTSNFVYVPSMTSYIESMTAFHDETKLGQWYKLDIFLDWEEMVYDISVDDSYLGPKSFPFHSNGIKAISISNIHPEVEVWIDEIYVGEDTRLGFQCSDLLQNLPTQYAWSHNVYERSNSVHEMIHHESHLFQREIYKSPDHSGLPFYDGQGHVGFNNAVKFKDTSEAWKMGSRHPESLLQVLEPPLQKSKYFYYGEYTMASPISNESNIEFGGIFSCSSMDLITWKNEGLMLSHRNITDMVEGSNRALIAKRAKVLFNHRTKKYVMWMILENNKNDLGMTGVATSDSAGGPFTFVRSFFPDGNRTKDQTLYVNENGTAFLLRSFYTTVDYILPEAVMQPIWESVKDKEGRTNFGLNFHRAFYEPGYDNFHDIDGDLSTYGVKSRFLDPSSPENNIWRPHSVVGVKAQPWEANYRDGLCGIRKRIDDLQVLDPYRIENRSNCSNIADNPTHPTPPDKLIGLEKVVETRLAKYVAISKLTDDYLDTTGVTEIFEGGLENGSSMVPLTELLEMEGFGWNPTMTLKSTYIPPMKSGTFNQDENWATLFHQYEDTYNDRAYYSLACLLDRKCPVNFRNQINQE